MPVTVRYFSDQGCPETWAHASVRLRLAAEYGDSPAWRHAPAGLARDLHERGRRDAGLWIEGPIMSTYPACIAVKAAAT